MDKIDNLFDDMLTRRNKNKNSEEVLVIEEIKETEKVKEEDLNKLLESRMEEDVEVKLKNVNIDTDNTDINKLDEMFYKTAKAVYDKQVKKYNKDIKDFDKLSLQEKSKRSFRPTLPVKSTFMISYEEKQKNLRFLKEGEEEEEEQVNNDDVMLRMMQLKREEFLPNNIPLPETTKFE